MSFFKHKWGELLQRDRAYGDINNWQKLSFIVSWTLGASPSKQKNGKIFTLEGFTPTATRFQKKAKVRKNPHEKNVIIYMSDSINGLHWVLAIARCEPIFYQSPKQIIAESSVYTIAQLPMTKSKQLLLSLWLCSHHTIAFAPIRNLYTGQGSCLHRIRGVARGGGGSCGARDPPLVGLRLSKQPTIFRWRRCHDNILAVKPLLKSPLF